MGRRPCKPLFSATGIKWIDAELVLIDAATILDADIARG